ncbi:MAG: hemerythrin domain-containing protein [Woeseiaceae bacterium]
MYSLEELKEQNQEISQLCDVLSVLMEQPSLHDNPFVCELMKRFKEKVWVHLVFEDNTIYATLLHTGDEKTSNTAKAFHDSAKEIKHRFSGFVRHWCSQPNSDSEHNELSNESREIFTLIKERITYENEEVFPLVENME